MRHWMLGLIGLLGMAQAVAAGWTFTPALTVSGGEHQGVFHHLEAAGRKSLAVSGDTVAVAWEDNHSGAPAAYVAFKTDGDSAFSAAQRLSGGKEAYAPTITSIGAGRFIAAWEQDGHLWWRMIGPNDEGPAQQADASPSGQASLTTAADGTPYAAWSDQAGRFRHIVVARLRVNDDDGVVAVWTHPVEAKTPQQSQLYPAIAVTMEATVVAWEDRRSGHTVLLTSRSTDGGQHFSSPTQLNTLPPSRSNRFGRGTGVTRVALATGGDDQVVATWMDKRAFRGGYDIYAAFSDDGGLHFGKNQLVQDMFGENTPQWHPAVAVSPDGRVVVVWDDTRDQTPDIWLSWHTPQGWSDDVAVGPASGAGAQASPVIAFGEEGKLHIAWVERLKGEPDRLRYAEGSFDGGE